MFIRSACLLIPQLNTWVPPKRVQYWVWNSKKNLYFQSNNLDVIFTHVSLCYLFFDPHLTTHQTNNYMCMIKRWHWGSFTPWTMKSSQGTIKYVIGCWTRPDTTSVYTKGKMPRWPWSSRSPTYIFKGLHYPLTWSNMFCGGRGKMRCYGNEEAGTHATKMLL